MEERLENLVIPRHVALILDGNGRWAKKRGLPRTAGHKQGCVAVEQIVEDAARLGKELRQNPAVFVAYQEVSVSSSAFEAISALFSK